MKRQKRTRGACRGRSRVAGGMLLLFWGAALMTACYGKKADGVPEPEFVLTYAENQPEDYPTTQGAYRFAELVRERTNGRIEIQISPAGELGDEQAVVKQLQFGGIDFVRVSLSILADDFPALNVLQLPYLYRDAAHMWKVLDGEIGADMMKTFEGSGMRALSWYDAGARSFYTTQKPVHTPGDMAGMRVRVQPSGLMEDVVRALGAEPVPMVYSDVYSALQTGVIDAAENNWPSYESMEHYRVARYFTVDEHTRIPELQLVSEQTWEKLGEEDREILLTCAQESAVYERTLWEERAKESEEKVRAAGCVVIELTEQEKEAFQEAVLPLYQSYCGDYGDQIQAILELGEE